MTPDVLKPIIQNLFDFAEKALVGKPIIRMALEFAEMYVMSHWDEWFKQAKAAGVIPAK